MRIAGGYHETKGDWLFCRAHYQNKDDGKLVGRLKRRVVILGKVGRVSVKKKVLHKGDQRMSWSMRACKM